MNYWNQDKRNGKSEQFPFFPAGIKTAIYSNMAEYGGKNVFSGQREIWVGLNRIEVQKVTSYRSSLLQMNSF